jgi:hypothetical protein
MHIKAIKEKLIREWLVAHIRAIGGGCFDENPVQA